MPKRSVSLIICTAITIACTVLGGVAGVSFLSLFSPPDSPVFRSLAKVVVGGRFVIEDEIQWEEQTQDLYGTILETIESAEMLRRAGDRVSAMHPDVARSDVSIRVAQSKGSAIMNILASGSEPKYTQTFLNALLDEFLAFRQAIREQAQGRVLSEYLEQVVEKQKGMESAHSEMMAMGDEGQLRLNGMELERLGPRIKMLRNERDDLKLALQIDPDGGAERLRRLKALEDEIEHDEKELVLCETKAARSRHSTERFKLSQVAYEKSFERAETFAAATNVQFDTVAIHERATIATEHIINNVTSKAALSGLGALAGFVVGILASFVVVGAGSHPAKSSA